MSKSSKLILWIVIIVAVGLIAWCYFGTTSSAAAPITAPITMNSPHSHPMIPASSTSSAPVSGLTTSSSDDSNAALDSDMSVISTQSAAMDQDSATANQSDQASQ